MYIPYADLDSNVDGRQDKCRAQSSTVHVVGYSSTRVEVAVIRTYIHASRRNGPNTGSHLWVVEVGIEHVLRT